MLRSGTFWSRRALLLISFSTWSSRSLIFSYFSLTVRLCSIRLISINSFSFESFDAFCFGCVPVTSDSIFWLWVLWVSGLAKGDIKSAALLESNLLERDFIWSPIRVRTLFSELDIFASKTPSPVLKISLRCSAEAFLAHFFWFTHLSLRFWVVGPDENFWLNESAIRSHGFFLVL